MKTKVCGTCGDRKSVDCFVRNRETRDGFTTQCRACSRARRELKREEDAQLGYEEHEPGYGHGV